METILVTGCAGFIGSHLCERLLSEGYRVIGVDNFDPFYPRAIKEDNLNGFINHNAFVFYELDICAGMDAIKETGISAIVHLAAKAGVRPSIEDPEGYIRTNILGTQKVHEFMRTNNVQKLIFASSSSVYGNNKKLPFSEDDNVDHPISPYAFTKKANELMNHTFHHLYKKDIVNLRFFTVYGPRQRPDLAIYKFTQKAINGEPLPLFGNGDTARDYTYITDTISGIYNAVQYCIRQDNVFVTVNLGNNTPVKLTDLVAVIYKNLGIKENVIFEKMQPGDVDITFADIARATELLQYKPATDIDTGIRKFIEWYRSKRN